MFNNTVKKADVFLESSVQDDFLKKYDTYSSSLKQLTQVLKNIENKDEIREQIDGMLEIHKKVEERLIKEKDCLFKDIRTAICREHLRHKYQSKSIRSTLVDRRS